MAEPKTIATLVVHQDVEHVDATLATASWWDKYVIKAGRYQVVTSYDRLVGEHTTIKLDAVLVESYRENRLFSAVQADHTTPNQEATFSLSIWPWDAEPGKTHLGGQATFEAPDAPEAVEVEA
jgi:hypothetical protein